MQTFIPSTVAVPEGPSTQYLMTLAIKSMVFGAGDLRYGVLGPSWSERLQVLSMVNDLIYTDVALRSCGYIQAADHVVRVVGASAFLRLSGVFITIRLGDGFLV